MRDGAKRRVAKRPPGALEESEAPGENVLFDGITSKTPYKMEYLFGQYIDFHRNTPISKVPSATDCFVIIYH